MGQKFLQLSVSTLYINTHMVDVVTAYAGTVDLAHKLTVYICRLWRT